MYRELILKTTINLYAHYGIRGVSMGQVAGAIRISKKTLYAEFGSKEELLCDCLDHEEDRLKKIFAQTETENKNPVEAIIVITHNLFQYKLYFCPAFHKDILKFGKAVDKLNILYEKMADRYYSLMEKGKDAGLFISDNDYETIARMFVELIYRSDTNKQVLIHTFLRGLCTDKGTATMDTIVPASVQSKIYNYN